jgi:hypothetical protein
MNTLQKMFGGAGCLLVSGASEAEVPVGYAAFAGVVFTDDTEIATLDELIDDTATELTDASWESVALPKQALIIFSNPVVKITLTNAGDMLMLYLDVTDYVEQGG